MTGRLLAAAAGVLLPLAFAPFHAWYLAPVLLAALFWTWHDQTPREAAIRGGLFGFAAFAAGTYWLYISIHIIGDAPVWLAMMLMLSLVSLMAAYIGLCGWLCVRLGGPLWVRWCAVWPAVWTLIEWLRGWLFSGFPWLSLGYGQIDGPLRGWAPVLGVYGVSLFTAVLAGVALTLWKAPGRGRRVAAAVTAVCIVGGALLLADRTWTQPDGPLLNVSLVQGSIPQERKWLRAQRVPTMELYRDLTLGLEDQDLVVWPEAAVPAIADVVLDYLEDLRREARARDMQLLLGILTFDPELETYSNTLLALGPYTGLYRKRHLVPFGEFFPVPSFVRSWMRLMSLPYSDTAPGPRDQPPLQVGSIGIAPSICYEDAFGGETLDFMPASGLLVNVSNDAWFGDSIAPAQHLQIARMRSLETGRTMLRSTNTGISAIIGPRGEIVDRSPQFETHVLSAAVQPRAGATPFIGVGNYAVVLFCLAVVGAAVSGARRRR